MDKLLYGVIGVGIGAQGMYLLGPAIGSSSGPADKQAATSPAYLVVTGEVLDRDAFMAGYASQLGPLYERHGGSYLVLGGNPEQLEGQATPSVVISRWPSRTAAQAFWSDPEYAPLKAARIDNGWADLDVVLVDGTEP